MRILTGTAGLTSVRPAPPSQATAAASEEAAPAGKPCLLRRLPSLIPDWREVTVNEVMVELPQAGIDLFHLKEQRPVAGSYAQGAVSALAFVRAYQGLSGSSVEQKMEGASSLALGVAGTLSLLPGQVAAHASQAVMVGQAALELSLGVRELHEELFVDESPDWKEIVSGSLDTIKGGSSFVPMFFPATADVVTGIQVVAMLGKAAFEATIHRGTDE